MKKIHKYLTGSSLLVLMAMMFSLTSCSDGLKDENLYTYKTDMMSDYLLKNANFSEFARIVQKAGKMDLLGTYGTYTCFAPTNAAVATYLEQRGLASVDQLTVEDCDTITRSALIGTIYYLADLAQITQDTIQSWSLDNNLLGQSMRVNIIDQVIETFDAYGNIQRDSVYSFRINGEVDIIYSLANDSVENGVVQPVYQVVPPSNMLLPYMMKKDEGISIYNTCLSLTGLDKEMLRVQDFSFEPRYWREEKKMERAYSTGNQMDYCHVPEYRKYGYTAFVVPDSILNNYGHIEGGWTKDILTWEDLYEYACEKYPEGQGQSYYGKSEEALKDARNPLHKLIAYHLMDRAARYDKLYTNCTIFRNEINPTEWYSTMNPFSMLKVEYVYATNRFRGKSQPRTLYINRMYDPDRQALTQRGAIVTSPQKQNAVNGYYHYIDRIIDYSEETQQTVFNTRMRIDLYTLFPEFMSNDLRTSKTYGGISDCPDPNSIAPNYIFPPGYLDNVTVSEDGDFFLQNCRNSFWSYEGDELNLRSDNDSYDITFNLPSVPTGQYQIRLGFCAMPRRGIAQFYVDGIPQGIPLDMRSPQTDEFELAKRGWKRLSSLSGEELEQCKKDMHNKGWYHGPKSVRNVTTGEGSVRDDNQLAVSNSSPFCDNNGILRKVIYEGPLDGNVQHTMRIRSVLAIGGAELMLDYLEMVPKSVYGIEGDEKGEDDL